MPVSKGAAALVAAIVVTATAVGGVVVADGSSGTFPLRVVAQTSSTITLGWDAQPGADGYQFSRNNVVVSRTFDSTRLTVKFSKGTSYQVAVLDVTQGAVGSYPPPPPPATTTETVPTGQLLELAGSYTSQAFAQAVSNAGAGYLTVRPKAGSSVTLQCGAFPARDHTTYERITFDGCGTVANNWVANWHDWKLIGDTIKNYYVASDPTSHSEGLYVGGCASDGVVDGVTFDHNGTTAHIFFTWFGGSCGSGDPYDQNNYPRNICVKNSHFANGLNPYFSVQWRDEIPQNAPLYVSPSNVFVGPGPQRSTKECV